ncbi:2-oxo acid dehydrogenase subunit E2 [Halogeometricum luteum]
MQGRGYTREPFSPRRRATVDAMRMAGRRNDVHGLVTFDVTEARRRIREREAETGERLSFTAFVAYCLARAVAADPRVQAYRDWRGRLVVFDDADVMVVVEREVDGERVGLPHVVRAANRRSLRSIHDEIRTAQRAPEPTHRNRWLNLAARLPGPVRRLFYRLPRRAPGYWKRAAGTVAVSSVGMFGTGGGWAVTPTNYALQLTVGGVSRRAVVVEDGDGGDGGGTREGEGRVETREFLHVTATFDHDVVDGAPAARFLERLRELVESARGLDGDEGASG